MNIYLERGKLLLSQNRSKEAEKEFRQALASEPNNAIAMALLAECYIDAQRYAEALEMGEKAVGMGPTNPFLQYTLARTYFYNKKMKKNYYNSKQQQEIIKVRQRRLRTKYYISPDVN